MFIIDRIQKRLNACSQFLSYDGRLLMVNAVLSSLPTFIMSCLLVLYKGIIEQIDKYKRHLFWRGKDLERKNPPLASWDLICKPKEKGGLGILNLHLQNTSLLLKMAHKFINHMDIPWVHLIWEAYYGQGFHQDSLKNSSFWWRDCMKLFHLYKDNASATLHNGQTLQFWSDNWNGPPKLEVWPHLHSFAVKQSITIFDLYQADDLAALFHLPLSEEAYEQF